MVNSSLKNYTRAIRRKHRKRLKNKRKIHWGYKLEEKLWERL